MKSNAADSPDPAHRSGCHVGKPITVQEERYTPISDLSIYQNKNTIMMVKRYPEAGKREGVDGGLNKSKTFKRRSSEVLSAKRDGQ